MSATLRNRYRALVRGDDDALHIREFQTAAAAALAAADRELKQPTVELRAVHSADLAREFGLSPRTVRRAWQRGELPAIEHGAHKLMVPTPIVALCRRYGLARVCRFMAGDI